LNTAAPSTHFLSAQSVYVDSSDTLGCWTWATSARARRSSPAGPKLVAIDLTTNAVKRTIVFPDSLITKGTSINDVRFDLARGAAGFAYIPDSSAAAGSGIIVVDLSTGNAVRRLGERSHRAARPGFPRDRGGQAVCHPATVDAAPSLVIGRGRRHRGFGGRQGWCTTARLPAGTCIPWIAAVLTDFTQSVRLSGRIEPGTRRVGGAPATRQSRRVF